MVRLVWLRSVDPTLPSEECFSLFILTVGTRLQGWLASLQEVRRRW